MNKITAAFLVLLLSLTVLCIPAFADELAAEDELTERGPYVALASQCNSGMMYTDIYFGTADPLTVGHVRIYDGEYEVVSDGTAEGDAAYEYYEETQQISVGTRVMFLIDGMAPTDGLILAENQISISGVKKIVLSGQAEVSEEDCAAMFGALNNCEYYSWDALIQFRYSLDGGKLTSEIYTLEPQDYLNRIDGLTVEKCEVDGSALKLGLRKPDGGELEIGISDFENLASPNDGTSEGQAASERYREGQVIKEETVINLVLRGSDLSKANLNSIDQDLWGIMFCEGSDAPPKTGLSLCTLPVVAALAAIAVAKKKK